MRGVAHDRALRAKLMAQHQEGVPLTVLSERHGIARPVLSRWWARYVKDDLAGLTPRSRRPHRSPTRHGPAVLAAIDEVRDFGGVPGGSPPSSGSVTGRYSGRSSRAGAIAGRRCRGHPCAAMR